MNANAWVRQSHRWLSLVFTLLVVANIVANAALGGEVFTLWLGLFTLLPLFLLLLTGLYLFALPYAVRRRKEQRSAG